ncbi:MAG: hypothetical protein AAB281_03950, partial [Actinomycetota bacterium]
MTETNGKSSATVTRKSPAAGILAGLLTVVLALIAGYAAVILASPTEVVVGPIRIDFALKPASHGKTIVEIPPAGSIEADTHRGPLVAEFTVKEIAVSDIGELTDPDSPGRHALENWRAPVREQVTGLIARIMTAAALAGAVIAGLLRRTVRWGLIGAAVGLTVAVSVAGYSYLTFDSNAFIE